MRVLGRGENKASAKIGREGLQVDLRALPRESFGSAMQYFTGSKDHNVAIRTARRASMGLEAQRVRPVPRRRRRNPGRGRNRVRRLRSHRPALDSRPSCAKTAAKSKPPPKAACPRWWSPPTSAAISTCTPRRRMVAPPWRKWPKLRARSAISTLPSPTIPRRSPWPTAWMKRRAVAFARRVREINGERPRHPPLLRHRVRHPASDGVARSVAADALS